MPTPNVPTPLPTPTPSATRERPPGYRRRRGWIEFRSKNGRRYARRRAWVKRDGQWVKEYLGRVAEIPPLTEEQYNDYVNRRAAAKRIRSAAPGHTQ